MRKVNVMDQIANVGLLANIFQFCGEDVKSIRLVSKNFSQWMDYLLVLEAKKKICTLAIDYLQMPFDKKEIYGMLKNFSLPELSYVGSLLVIHSIYVLVGTKQYRAHVYYDDHNEKTLRPAIEIFYKNLKNNFFRRSVALLLRDIWPRKNNQDDDIRHKIACKLFYKHLQSENLAKDIKKCPLIQFITPYQLPTNWETFFSVSTVRAELILATGWLIQLARNENYTLSSRMSEIDWQQDATLKEPMLMNNAAAVTLLDSMLTVYKPDEIVAFVRLQETFFTATRNYTERFFPGRDIVKFYEKMSLLTAEQVADFCGLLQEVGRKTFFDSALVWSGRLANVLLDLYLQSPTIFPVFLKKMSPILGLLRYPGTENVVKLFMVAHKSNDSCQSFIMNMQQFIYFFVVNEPELVQRLLEENAELLTILSSMSSSELKIFSFFMPFGRFPEVSIEGVVAGIKKMSQQQQYFLAGLNEAFKQIYSEQMLQKLSLMKPILNFQPGRAFPILMGTSFGNNTHHIISMLYNFSNSYSSIVSLLLKYVSFSDLHDMFKITQGEFSIDLMHPSISRFFCQHLVWNTPDEIIQAKVVAVKNFMKSQIVSVLFKMCAEVDLNGYFLLWQKNSESIEKQYNAIVSYHEKSHTTVITLLRQSDVDQFIAYLGQLPEIIRKNIKDVCAAYQLYKTHPLMVGHLGSQNLLEYVLLRHATVCWPNFISSMPAFDLDATDEEKKQFTNSVMAHYQKEGVAVTQFINTDGCYLRDLQLQLYQEKNTLLYLALQNHNVTLIRVLNRQEFRGLRAMFINQAAEINKEVAEHLVVLLSQLYGGGQVNLKSIVNLMSLLSYFGMATVGRVLQAKENNGKDFIVKFINSVDSQEWLMVGYLASEFAQLITNYEATFLAEVNATMSMQL